MLPGRRVQIRGENLFLKKPLRIVLTGFYYSQDIVNPENFEGDGNHESDERRLTDSLFHNGLHSPHTDTRKIETNFLSFSW